MKYGEKMVRVFNELAGARSDLEQFVALRCYIVEQHKWLEPHQIGWECWYENTSLRENCFVLAEDIVASLKPT